MTTQDDAGDTDTADEPAAGEDSASASPAPADETSPAPGACPVVPPARPKGIIDNLPYIAMILLGTAIFLAGVGDGLWRWLAAGLYVFYGAAGAVWIMIFLCPYCRFYDTRMCSCGYGRIAPKLRARKDPDLFARQFRRHIPVIVPLWFIPPIAGVVFLFGGFSWPLLTLVIAFAVNSFLILPLVSKRYGCANCPQKETCPWMSRSRRSA